MSGYLTRRMTGARHPHQFYAATVAGHLELSLGAAPTEWGTDADDDGTLTITCLYRPIAPGRDDTGLPRLSADPEAWPHGVELYWDEHHGWQYIPLDEDSEPLRAEPVPLPVPVLASPQALAALLPALLAGREHELPADTREWQYADELRAELAARNATR
ncbi:hypothetical protein [Streptomyces sp.]|uniref:hypothetical protein n=1 Tax=Streptomyces sp. TaxID=1931 RepID=UPI002F3EBDE0